MLYLFYKKYFFRPLRRPTYKGIAMKTIYILLTRSGTLLSKDSTLMHPNDYAQLPQLKCLYEGCLADLPQRKAMDLGETPSMVSIYTGLLVELLQRRAQRFFE